MSTRPSKKCKSLIDAPILRRYLVFGEGDEKWIRDICSFVEKKKTEKEKVGNYSTKYTMRDS